MKKIITLSMVVAVAVILSACGKKTTPTETDTTNTNQPVAANLRVQDGDRVGVMYVGTHTDGEVFDTNVVDVAQESGIYNELRAYEPLVFTVGQRGMIPGFEQAVIGMEENENKTVTIPAADAYGDVRQDLIQSFPTDTFDEAGVDWQAWEVGEQYNIGGLQGTIAAVDSGTVTFDFNHPLAGQDLIFDITVVSIER